MQFLCLGVISALYTALFANTIYCGYMSKWSCSINAKETFTQYGKMVEDDFQIQVLLICREAFLRPQHKIGACITFVSKNIMMLSKNAFTCAEIAALDETSILVAVYFLMQNQ